MPNFRRKSPRITWHEYWTIGTEIPRWTRCSIDRTYKDNTGQQHHRRWVLPKLDAQRGSKIPLGIYTNIEVVVQMAHLDFDETNSCKIFDRTFCIGENWSVKRSEALSIYTQTHTHKQEHHNNNILNTLPSHTNHNNQLLPTHNPKLTTIHRRHTRYISWRYITVEFRCKIKRCATKETTHTRM